MALPLLGVLNTSLGLAKQVAKIVHNNKLMDAGEARAIVKGLEDVENRIENALARAADLSHDADSVRGDDANRANDGIS